MALPCLTRRSARAADAHHGDIGDQAVALRAARDRDLDVGAVNFDVLGNYADNFILENIQCLRRNRRAIVRQDQLQTLFGNMRAIGRATEKPINEIHNVPQVGVFSNQ